jgi:hypothetical protein
MFRLLLFMHPIAFCTTFIAPCRSRLIFVHMRRPRGARTRGQVQGVFGGPQASGCKDGNIVMIKESPGASHPILDFYFN